MVVTIRETVLTYEQSQLDAWKAGDKSLLTSCHTGDPGFWKQPKQPAYYFGEAFTLRHFWKTEGWHGSRVYAFFESECELSEHRRPGYDLVTEFILAEKLERLRSIRCLPDDLLRGGGKPDLFLYRQPGDYKFVEVKKGSDVLRPNQLRCIAQILKTLDCPVEIVYLRERGHRRTPQVYSLDLEALCEVPASGLFRKLGLPVGMRNASLRGSAVRPLPLL